MSDHTPEEPDTSQPEPEDLVQRVEKIYKEWLQSKKVAQVKLKRDDRLANRPDPKKEQ